MGLKSFIKKEPVLCAAALAAAVSCFFVPPDAGYLKYIDMRTIALLYCLMVVVAGLSGAGVFTALAHSLCRSARGSRAIALVLVLLCFFSAMFITNDVALITFVPFAVTVLGLTGKTRLTIFVVVLQTVAANLGSMLTPVGNPQSLHIFSHYDMGLGQFVATTGPVCAASLVLVSALCLIIKNETLQVDYGQCPGVDKKRTALCLLLFVLSLCVVLHLLDWYILLPIVVVVLAAADRRLLLKADFCLLATFVCFYIFVGNVARIAAVRETLDGLTQGRELISGVLLSQVISNVPAAVLLSGFTENARELLLGVNIGGLGTPIASMASLISLKLYAQSPDAKPKYFMMSFLLINLLLLGALLLFSRTALI